MVPAAPAVAAVLEILARRLLPEAPLVVGLVVTEGSSLG